MSVQRPAYQAKRYHHSQVDQLATNNIAIDFSRRFHSPLAFHVLWSPPPRWGRARVGVKAGGAPTPPFSPIPPFPRQGGRSKTPLPLGEGIKPTSAIRNLVIRCLPFSNVDWHIVTQQQIAGVEKIFALVRCQGKNARIHTDSVTWAGLDAEAAEHTAQLIDHERGRVFFYRRIGVFTGLSVNAQGWARRSTEHTGGAAWRAIFFAHQAMAPAIALRNVGGLFRVLLRDRMASPKHVRHKMAGGHRHPSQDFRDIQFLPECERLHRGLPIFI